jgi:nucleotide-binding universal stress UspA family protein
VLTLQRIVVGIDGSDGAARALTWATDLAGALGAEVVAVHPPNRPLGPRQPAAHTPFRSSPRKSSMRGARRNASWLPSGALLSSTPIRKHRILNVLGEPAAVIMDTPEHEKADLIVAGRRGRGGFTELILGSISHHLIHHSHVPVVIIPAESEQHDSPVGSGVCS